MAKSQTGARFIARERKGLQNKEVVILHHAHIYEPTVKVSAVCIKRVRPNKEVK